MPRYMQDAARLKDQVKQFVNLYAPDDKTLPATKREFIKDLGYLLSKAIQCHTRPLQTTVRKNIIQEAVGEWCNVQVVEDTLLATPQYPTPKTIKKVIIRSKD